MTTAYEPMTRDEVLAAQAAWADAVVARDVDALLALYDLDAPERPLLFKPTKAPTIRTDREGARSYFVGGSERFPEDHGFLHGAFTRVTFHSATGPVAELDGLLWHDMGHYRFEHAGGGICADYTFSYRKVGGRVLIGVHHSSFNVVEDYCRLAA